MGRCASFIPYVVVITYVMRRAEGREARVGSWRSFTAAPKKKKKAKVNILG